MSLTPHGYRADPPSPSPSFAQTGAELDLESDLEFDYDIEQDAHDQRQQYLNSNSNSHSNPSGHRRRGITDSDSDDNDEYDDYDEEDDDDLRSEVFGGEGSYDAEEEAYEMRDRNTSSDRAGGSRWHQPPKREKTQGSSLRRLSATSVASFQLYTPDEEQTVRRKFDRRLVLFVAMLYMLSFLDRSNIGNARIAGMDDDLQTDPPNEAWYSWALTAFYISYIAFEWMSLLWRLIPAHIYISILVLSWGITASLQAVAPSYPVLIALRVVLGIGEAGFTGIPFYLSFFFKRDELAFRTAIFLSAGPLAITFASTLAWAIVKFAKLSPIAPWRLLFLIEGFPSVVISVIAWSVIPDSPQTASYLTKREKKVARLRLRNEATASPDNANIMHHTSEEASKYKIMARDLLAVLIDPKAWITAIMFFLTNMAYSSLPVFLPKIMTEMGHDAVAAQALSAPPFLLTFVILLYTAHVSDRRRARTIPLVFHALFSALGYTVLAIAEVASLPPVVRYIAIFPAAIGFFNVVALTVAWNINNQKNQNRQGGGFALLQIIGQCGPLVGTRLYPHRDAPYYTSGMRTCALAMFFVALLAIALRFYLSWQNRKLDAVEYEKVADGEVIEEEGLVGSKKRRRAPEDAFRYIL